MNFGEMIVRGMCTAGWVIGFVAVLGAAICVIGLLCTVLTGAVKDDDGGDDSGKFVRLKK